ncbi:pyrroloquinoline quinone biosynthesis peptide chaperone PqqD [Streptomyces sp. NPDC002896]|uniref:pyrroloquinoline quinone biosynthesis peptide chaperone PqqD n=1 Tax=Streptomyces sp. NPDC002896 TaxID=3154438 RepID=UPI00332CE285
MTTPSATTSSATTSSATTSSATTPSARSAEEQWRPRLAPAIVLRHDRVRGVDLLVMPERVVVLSGRAAAVLALCDGERDVRGIVGELAARFPGAPVATDVPAFLQRLRAEGWLG